MYQMFFVHMTSEEFEKGGFTSKTHQMFSVHTTQEKFENEGFVLKTHQMFSVHTTQEKFQNGGFMLTTRQKSPVHPTQEEFENGGFEPLQRRGTSAKVPMDREVFENIFGGVSRGRGRFDVTAEDLDINIFPGWMVEACLSTTEAAWPSGLGRWCCNPEVQGSRPPP